MRLFIGKWLFVMGGLLSLAGAGLLGGGAGMVAWTQHLELWAKRVSQ